MSSSGPGPGRRSAPPKGGASSLARLGQALLAGRWRTEPSGSRRFTPAASGYHGVVVYAENAGSGSYRVSFWRPQTGVEEPVVGIRPRAEPRFRPNPAAGFVRLSGAVGTDLRSSDGRLVTRLAAGDNDIRSLRPGVYFAGENDGWPLKLVVRR